MSIRGSNAANSHPPVARRRSGFLPGVSGNPSGRPKLDSDLKSALQLRLPERIRALEKLASTAKSEQVRLTALIYLADRGFGGRLPVDSGMPGAGELLVRVEYVNGAEWRPLPYKPAESLPEPRVSDSRSGGQPEMAQTADLKRLPAGAAAPANDLQTLEMPGREPEEAEDRYGLRPDRPGYVVR